MLHLLLQMTSSEMHAVSPFLDHCQIRKYANAEPWWSSCQGFLMAQAQIAQTVVQATPDAESAAPGGLSQLRWAYRITEVS